MVKYFFSIFFIVFLNTPANEAFPLFIVGCYMTDGIKLLMHQNLSLLTLHGPNSNSKTGASTHRCKSCHGWDYKGKNGDYSKGKYMTGINGIESYIQREKNYFNTLQMSFRMIKCHLMI